MTVTKTETRRVNARLRELGQERSSWLRGAPLRQHWGMAWCAGPGSEHCHQPDPCEGCGVVALCKDRADEIGAQIKELLASLAPPAADVYQPSLF